MQWGIQSVLWVITSVLWRITLVLEDKISTVEGIQYCGGIASLLWEITAVHVRDSISTVGIPSVL